jgi:hypothetical protein
MHRSTESSAGSVLMFSETAAHKISILWTKTTFKQIHEFDAVTDYKIPDHTQYEIRFLCATKISH